MLNSFNGQTSGEVIQLRGPTTEKIDSNNLTIIP